MYTNSDVCERENGAIEELRNRLKGDIEQELYDDKYLFLRFLRARDFNIKNAEAMLRKNLQWREENDVKNILSYKIKEVIDKYYIYFILGYDKDGCVIRCGPTGNLDTIGIMKSCTHEDLMKYAIFESETDTFELKKQSEKLGRNVDQCVYIHNFENLTFAAATSKRGVYFTIHALNIFINNYPERLKACYVLNDSYKKDLLKIIDADVLPSFLGGNKTDPDGNPLCLTFVNHGGEPVPEKYYLHKGKHLLSKEPDVKKITLSRAAFYEEKIDIKEVGSFIEWEFETKYRDIGFGLFYNEIINEEEKVTELIPLQRIDTEEYPETGTYRCDRTGKYVIVLDNTYSWIRQKEIFIRTNVLTPEKHQIQLRINQVDKY